MLVSPSFFFLSLSTRTQASERIIIIPHFVSGAGNNGWNREVDREALSLLRLTQPLNKLIEEGGRESPSTTMDTFNIVMREIPSAILGCREEFPGLFISVLSMSGSENELCTSIERSYLNTLYT